MNTKKCLTLLSLVLLFINDISAQCNTQRHYRSHQVVQSDHHKDIVDRAVEVENLSTLVVAVKTAGLVETLKSEGPFTVFAPTNTAFDKLPDGTLANLLKPDQKSGLTKVLTYHVVSGSFNARDVMTAIESSGGKFELKTVSGDILTFSKNGSSLLIGDENKNVVAVVQADVAASNGVVHIIDGVLLPN